jgi:hypothetical protein
VGRALQSYSSTPINEKNAVGSKFALNFSYDLWNRNRPDALTFEMAVEDRRPLGTDLPPLFAGLGAGSIVPTAATRSEFDLGITQAYIRQSVLQNRSSTRSARSSRRASSILTRSSTATGSS